MQFLLHVLGGQTKQTKRCSPLQIRQVYRPKRAASSARIAIRAGHLWDSLFTESVLRKAQRTPRKAVGVVVMRINSS
jgi:hypothetical protein